MGIARERARSPSLAHSILPSWRGCYQPFRDQVSQTAGGPPISGCTACAWTNLTGYSATLSSGTVWKWSGDSYWASRPSRVRFSCPFGPPTEPLMRQMLEPGQNGSRGFDANGEERSGRSSDRKPALRIPIIVDFSAAHSGVQTASVHPPSTIRVRPLPVCGLPR